MQGQTHITYPALPVILEQFRQLARVALATHHLPPNQTPLEITGSVTKTSTERARPIDTPLH